MDYDDGSGLDEGFSEAPTDDVFEGKFSFPLSNSAFSTIEVSTIPLLLSSTLSSTCMYKSQIRFVNHKTTHTGENQPTDS